MSEKDKDPSTSAAGGDGGGGGGGEEGEEGVKEERGKKGEREAKRVSVFRLGKAKKRVVQSNWRWRWRWRWRRRKKKKGNLVNSVGCCLCLRQSQMLDSSGESTPPPTSDPNSKDFTYDMLKVFIEKNDFYAADCNPHLDLDAKS
ncbi:hypothetical protein ACH5RR_001772 [Cinchona calisaya]|uniref:Uncharacterized protein n=1 Tax=Cinchona calisaya TaxID=153742 RepID=A0ABD3B4S2_9GENT